MIGIPSSNEVLLFWPMRAIRSIDLIVRDSKETSILEEEREERAERKEGVKEFFSEFMPYYYHSVSLNILSRTFWQESKLPIYPKSIVRLIQGYVGILVTRESVFKVYV